MAVPAVPAGWKPAATMGFSETSLSELSQELREETAGAGCFAYSVFRQL